MLDLDPDLTLEIAPAQGQWIDVLKRDIKKRLNGQEKVFTYSLIW